MLINTNQKSAKSRKSDLNLASKQKSAGTPFGFAIDDDQQSEERDVEMEEQIQPFVPEDEEEDEIEEESSPDVQVVDVPMTPESEEEEVAEEEPENAAMQFERASPIRGPKLTQTPRQSQLARSSPRREQRPASPVKASPIQFSSPAKKQPSPKASQRSVSPKKAASPVKKPASSKKASVKKPTPEPRRSSRAAPIV